MDPELQWSISSITGSTLTSEPPGRKGPNITFTYTTLPSSWVGWKNLYLTHPAVSCMDYQLVEIFYSFSATNHPGEGSGTTENWYYYYGQTTADTGAQYDSGGSYTSTEYPYNYYVGNLLIPCLCPPIGDNANAELWGIDTYAVVSRHEYRHYQDFMSWWGPAGWNPPNNDQDWDLIPDNLEPGFSASEGGPYDPEKTITYPIPNWPSINDCERKCLFTQQPWTVGSLKMQDWAYRGSQWH
jgi:hypothetical protein